ncbi:MAG TPA: hypothetical protein VKZ96_00860 [Thermomicrobiales bacterium]|nr:hypothetical protein [Thermomicrobiales bacterium]
MADYTLPYRTDWQEMAAVLDYAKGGGGADRAALDARFGAGEAMRETLNALEQLGLAVRDESGGVRLTELGDRVAYAPNEAARIQALLEAMVGYPPYRIPLERAIAEGDEVIDAPWVEHVWQVDMRLGQPRNRVAEARTFFFRLADAAGLGTYRRGVRGQTTRLELAEDAAERLRPLLERPVEAFPTEESAAVPSGAPEPTTPAPPVTSVPAVSHPGAATISITVDMTDWDLDRIAAFLKLIGYPIVE